MSCLFNIISKVKTKLGRFVNQLSPGLLLLAVPASHAYIPEYSLITSRMADQHGKNAYLIEQQVTIKRDQEISSLKETWLVTGEQNLRVTVEGLGPLKGLVGGTYIYEGAQRSYFDHGQNTIRTVRMGDEWLEPLFHFRYGKYFRSRLVNLKIAPTDSLKDRAPLSAAQITNFEPAPFLRLARADGTLSWAIGSQPPGPQTPTAWVEQDQFVLRKLRLPNQVSLLANDYIKYDETFYFPRNRVLNFGPVEVQIQTLSVKSLGKLKPNDPRLKTSSLTLQNAVKLPEVDSVRDFYSRFR